MKVSSKVILEHMLKTWLFLTLKWEVYLGRSPLVFQRKILQNTSFFSGYVSGEWCDKLDTEK